MLDKKKMIPKILVDNNCSCNTNIKTAKSILIPDQNVPRNRFGYPDRIVHTFSNAQSKVCYF